MRKTTMLRLLCLALLAALASFGTFNVTAQPAQALTCFPTFFGCTFDHIEDLGNAICCSYICPNGHTRLGVCEQK